MKSWFMVGLAALATVTTGSSWAQSAPASASSSPSAPAPASMSAPQAAQAVNVALAKADVPAMAALYQENPDPAVHVLAAMALERIHYNLDKATEDARLCEKEAPPAVIFCTAHDEFALEAFQVSAVGYVVKPVRREDLAEALHKAQRPNRMQLAALTRPQAGGGGPRTHISARTRKGIELIPLEQVLYFIADHKYVTLRHSGGPGCCTGLGRNSGTWTLWNFPS